jgi:predicted nucleic acid-binding protein
VPAATAALLLDASVWVAAVDRDDPYHHAARPLVLDPTRPLAALDLTLYEIANVVGTVKGRSELAGRMCRAILRRSDGNLARIDAALAEHAMKFAAEHRLTAYDAAYVAAARRYAWTLVSADVKDLVKPRLALAPDDPRLADRGQPATPA